MTTALSFLLILLVSSLLLVAAIAPNQSLYSPFERKRRRQEGIDTRRDDLRERRFVDVESLRRIVQSFILVLLAVVAIGVFGLWGGLLIVILVVISYGALARNVLIARFAQRLYDEHEDKLLVFLQRHTAIFKWFRHSMPAKASHVIDSKQELEHFLASTHGIVSDEGMRLLKGSLHFEDQRVRHVMTPKKDIFSIKKSEILGPLVLDDLHKSGYGSFPVTSTGKLDDIVGILRLRDVQTLDTSRQHTAKVETAMDPDIHFIDVDQSLNDALHVLLSSQQHMLVVKDDTQDVVGIVTLDGILQTLFGPAS